MRVDQNMNAGIAIPFMFRWMAKNIGLHHSHRRNPRIPNHRLPQCREQMASLPTGPAPHIARPMNRPFAPIHAETATFRHRAGRPVSDGVFSKKASTPDRYHGEFEG